MILSYWIHLRDFDFFLQIKVPEIYTKYIFNIYYTKNNTIKFHILFAIDAVLRSEYNIFWVKKYKFVLLIFKRKRFSFGKRKWNVVSMIRFIYFICKNICPYKAFAFGNQTNLRMAVHTYFYKASFSKL